MTVERLQRLSDAELIARINLLPDFKWDDEGAELNRRGIKYHFETNNGRERIIRE
jgi:hypothetical protein